MSSGIRSCRILIALCGVLSVTRALAEEPIRIGALAYGTLAWELSALDLEPTRPSGFKVTVDRLASPDAARIALQGHAVDLIVTDWIWVAEQRLKGQDYQFVPFSALHGALIVPPGSSIHSLSDLKGKRLGIAGGGLDKNWQLLKEAARRTAQLDLEHAATLTFAAPPLLSETLKQGRLDAVLTYWTQAALLKAEGYEERMNGKALENLLGLKALPPTLGYVFRESWAKTHEGPLEAFLDATRRARSDLCRSDRLWHEIEPLTQTRDPKALSSLREGYCVREAHALDASAQEEAKTLFGWLDRGSGAAAEFPQGVFYETSKNRAH